MKKSDYLFIFLSFVVWRVFIFAVLFFAVKFIPLQENFLGGGMRNYLSNPYFWAWGNFDGEHYLAISQFGYQPLTYFFFPLFPLLIKLLGGGQLAGLVISHVSLLIALIGLYGLVRIDYSLKTARLTVMLLLSFPTSFFFGSVYTESIFLALVVWFFWFLRKKKWVWVVILGTLASAARITGIILLVPFGLLAYIYYLLRTTGDPLAFVHNLSLFGGQRSESLILFPQAFYRYVFKIIPNLDYSYFPAVFTTLLEFGVAVVFLVLAAWSIKKVKPLYSYYLIAGYVLSSISGSFSSLPRYVLVLFPGFILMAQFLEGRSVVLKSVVLAVFVALLIISVMLFTRGYFVA